MNAQEGRLRAGRADPQQDQDVTLAKRIDRHGLTLRVIA